MSFDPDARIDGGDVRFTMHFPDGMRTVRIRGDALAEYFGADSGGSRMLEAYRANFRAIHALAQQLGAAHAGDVTITADDLRAAGHARR
ncbi:hypothetical protein AKI39_03380 [Bordetella sp. H567]|uniref:hypothetical protein n=1 Tax=Bordetella sp. H567 TaxID=1697043 RepID=UPI00081CD414|nr:hypothetical protein [Bordetella sp. H567]AOB29936.1 hypothetical protein AKI39_03380 [Bordetella sp. H567]